MINCKKCGKEIEITNKNIKYHKKLKYCNSKCWYESTDFKMSSSKGGKIGGPVGGKKIQELYPNQCRENGKKSVITNRENGTSMFFDKKLQSKAGKHVTFETHSKGGSNSQKTLKSKGAGIYNKNVQIKGGLASQYVLRHNVRNLLFKGQYYDSILEIEISLCLQEQYGYVPKENKTLHVRIGKYEYDYLIKKLKLFIEFHQWFKNETEEEYYMRKRLNLNKNGYKKYNLIVIK